MIWLALAPLAFVVVWVFFLAYIALRANWQALAPEVKVVGALVVLVGVVLDVALNWTLGVLLMGVTRDATLSQKCGRLKRAGGWRGRCAAYLCERWLDPFEIGGHCRG